MDYPHIRQTKMCPICKGEKDQGLVACWSCYRVHGLKWGNAAAERIIARCEVELVAA